MRLSWSRKISRPRLVIADIADAFSRDGLLRCLPTGSPRLSKQCGERDVRLVLKVQNGPVFPHRLADLGYLSAQPVLPFFLRQFEVFALGLLVGQTGLVQSPQHGLLRKGHVEFSLDDLNEPSCGPEVGLAAVRGRRGQDHLTQSVAIQLDQLPRPPDHRPPEQSIFTSFCLVARKPSMNRAAVGSISLCYHGHG